MEYIIIQVFPKCSLLFNSGEGGAQFLFIHIYVLTVILDFLFAVILYARHSQDELFQMYLGIAERDEDKVLELL